MNITIDKRLLSVAAFFVVLALCCPPIYSQSPISSRDVDGLREKPQRLLVISNVTIVLPADEKSSQRIISNGVVILRNERIDAVGSNLEIPKGATVRDGKGLWIYPAFVEPYMEISPPKAGVFPAESDEDELPGNTNQERGALYWNPAVRPEKSAAEQFRLEKNTVDDLRSVGFATVHCNAVNGIFRGHSVTALLKEGTADKTILRDNVAQWLSFRKGKTSVPYPSSMMGSIALIRQAVLDAQWYAAAHVAYKNNPKLQAPEINLSLDALHKDLQSKAPFVMETNNEHTFLRGIQLQKEFALEMMYVGSGLEYRRLSSIDPKGKKIILPLNFPAAPDVSTPDRARDVDLEDLLHWDAAPSNPRLLDSSGAVLAFTSRGLKNKSDYLVNIRKAIQYGLPPEKALAAMTVNPANFAGSKDLTGKLSPGMLANIIVADGDIFQEKTTLLSVFVAGEETILTKKPEYDYRGKWTLKLDGNYPSASVDITGTLYSPKASAKIGSAAAEYRFKLEFPRMNASIASDSLGLSGTIRMSGSLDSLKGVGVAILPNGTSTTWKMTRDSAHVEKPDTAQTKLLKPHHAVFVPDMPFGNKELPKAKSCLIKNAKIWTCNENGDVLDGVDLFLANGKISDIGKNLSAAADIVIDAKGRGVSPGIIDEHSHIAIEGGVNEGTHAVTAEVRIGDVLNPDDVNIYRQLAGGVTSSHLLHGSANPIGGQLQLIKLRWGQDAEGLKFEGAPGTIKFALGENVKQSNWGDRFTTRYPQSRMGVEEIMRDGFQAALEYEKEQKNPSPNSLPLRRDIQLETLLEIIRGKRFIHCHSYVQSEILMLMRLTEEFQFTVQTFTHILEGYKLAAEMAKHGAGASSFADWWAYKFEVVDAIPNNAAIMHEQGVLTSINSDDAEMARRLNQEAAKSIRYDNMSESDALKMVTINPAKQLKVHNRTGSIEKGKDADIVLWSGNPLSNFSRVEKTWVDGILYFDRETDVASRKYFSDLRAELEQKALTADKKGDSNAPSGKKKRRLYDCEDIEDEMSGNWQ